MANADIVYEATRLMLRLEDPDKIPSVLDCLKMMGMTYAALKFSGLKQKVRELKRHPIHGEQAEKILAEWKNDDLASGSRPIPSSSSSSDSSSGASSGYSSSSSPTDSCDSPLESATPPAAPTAVAAVATNPSVPAAAAAAIPADAQTAHTTRKRKSTGSSGAPSAKQLIITEHNEPKKWADFKIPKATGPKLKTASAILESVLGGKTGNSGSSKDQRSERKQEAVRRAKLITARLAMMNKSKNDEEKKRKEIPSLLTLEIDLTKMV